MSLQLFKSKIRLQKESNFYMDTLIETKIKTKQENQEPY